MATNAEEDTNEEEITSTEEVSTEDNSPVAEDGQTDDQDTESESQDEERTFTKGEGFDWVKGDTPEEAYENLKSAYQNSSKEALKWKKVAEGSKEEEADEASEGLSPILRQAERRERDAMNKEYDSFTESYPQINEPGNAEKLEKRVLTISKAVQEEENRAPSFAEALSLAANSLGWKADQSEQISSSVKGQASTSTRTGQVKPETRSKVTAAQVKEAKKFSQFQGKSDAEIIKELEPHAA